MSQHSNDGIKVTTLVGYLYRLPAERRAVEAVKFTAEWQEFQCACRWARGWCEKNKPNPQQHEKFQDFYDRFERNVIEPLERRFERLKDVFKD